MHRIFACTFAFACLCGVWSQDSSASRFQRAKIQDNRCVSCHSRLSMRPELSSKFLEWRVSRHAANGVTCDNCHGGDKTARDPVKAHIGVAPPSNKNSRIHRNNSPETCGGCHVAVVNSFIESMHYQKLKTSGPGPTCVDCHGHMGSSVARMPFEGESLCTFCHNAVNGPLPQRPDIVRKAKSTLDAIARTNYTVAWINEMLAEARKKKLNVKDEEEDLQLLKITLAEAKAGWHAFILDAPGLKAGKSFDEAVRIKDGLSKRLGHD